MDEDRFPSNFSDRFGEHRRDHHPEHHHHGRHGKPARLIVFFLENETPRGQIDDQLDRIYIEASSICKSYNRHFGAAVPAHLFESAKKRLHEILGLIRSIREEVISMTTTAIQPPAGAVSQLVIGDPIGILVAVLEADDSGTIFFPPEGPLQFNVSDPSNTVKQGVAADGVTPTFLDNGSGNTGDVDVEVTDAGNNLVGSASFSVVSGAPPPPPAATQLGVFFVPNSGSSSAPAPGAGAAPSAAEAAVKKAQVASGTATTVDPHHNTVK